MQYSIDEKQIAAYGEQTGPNGRIYAPLHALGGVGCGSFFSVERFDDGHDVFCMALLCSCDITIAHKCYLFTADVDDAMENVMSRLDFSQNGITFSELVGGDGSKQGFVSSVFNERTHAVALEADNGLFSCLDILLYAAQQETVGNGLLGGGVHRLRAEGRCGCACHAFPPSTVWLQR